MYNHYLETFIAVADEGSFTRAAESLTLSPTAVMKQINMLENELDVQLFNRTHQGVKLTAGGKIIYDAALKLIAFANKQTERAREAEDQENHTIVIGTSTVCPCKSLIDIWYEISDDHPEYHIKIVPFEEDHTNTLTRLQTKTTAFDCVVSPCESKKWLEYVNILQLGMTRYCVSVPASHPLAQKKIITYQDLNDRSIMMPAGRDGPTTCALYDSLMTRVKDIKVISVPFFYDMEIFNRCLEENNVLMSLDIWKNIHPMLVSIPFIDDFLIPYDVIYKKEPARSVKTFASLIKEKIKPSR